jgi:hypothetical protein
VPTIAASGRRRSRTCGPAFELLLMKVLSLLQDRDPKLAHDVSTSRDAIWGVLVDPHKLAEFS